MSAKKLTICEVQCCFGKDAWGNVRCQNAGKWRFKNHPGASRVVQTYTFCDAHKSKHSPMVLVTGQQTVSA